MSKGRNGKRICKKCRCEAVQKRRHKLKQMSVEYKGGKCKECGFSGHPACYDFHHIDPNEKDFGISSKGYTLKWEKVKTELDKCILLCANCHRLKHAS